MCELYSRIEELCKSNGTNVTAMCRELSIPRTVLSELKSGRSKSISAKYTNAIANFFGVSVDYIINGTEDSESKVISNDDIKVALFGGDDEVTDEMWEEVKGFVDYVKNKYRKPPNGGGN